MPGGGPLKTPRSASVRIVDEMGREVEEPSEQNDSEDTVTEVRYSRQEALQRMKRAVADLQDGLRGVDTWFPGCLFSELCCWMADFGTDRMVWVWTIHD